MLAAREVTGHKTTFVFISIGFDFYFFRRTTGRNRDLCVKVDVGRRTDDRRRFTHTHKHTLLFGRSDRVVVLVPMTIYLSAISPDALSSCRQRRATSSSNYYNTKIIDDNDIIIWSSFSSFVEPTWLSRIMSVRHDEQSSFSEVNRRCCGQQLVLYARVVYWARTAGRCLATLLRVAYRFIIIKKIYIYPITLCVSRAKSV